MPRMQNQRTAESWLEHGARLGFAVKGIVYATIGLLAARLALGQNGGATTDPEGALRAIGASAYGRISLTVIGVGLIAYCGWRLLAALRASDDDGDGLSSTLPRLGKTLDGMFHGALGYQSLTLLSRTHRGKASEDVAQHMSAKALPYVAGKGLLIAVALGMVVYALYQIYRQLTHGSRDHLEFGDASEGTRRIVDALGRYGTTAMSVVLLIVAWMLIQATLAYDPTAAGGVGRSLARLFSEPNGRFLLGAVSVGMLSFGAFQIASARYRSIRL